MTMGALVLGGIIIGSSAMYSQPTKQPIEVKKPLILTNKEVFNNAPFKIEANESVTWKKPIRTDGIAPLLEMLKGFGDLINQPYSELIKPDTEFAKKDAEIIKQTKYVLRNPTNLVLGQECGLPGAQYTYPPGSDVGPVACGGTPGFGGTSCNTSPQCYFSGRCFWICTPYECSCKVTSCYGKCGNSSAYIWDSVTHTCGCGTGGGINIPNQIPTTTTAPSTTLSNGLTVDSSGNATNNIAGVDFSGKYNPNGASVMFDSSMTQAEKDDWLAANPNAMNNAAPGTVFYVAPTDNFNIVSEGENVPPSDAFTCGGSWTCANMNGQVTDGIFINSDLTGTAAENGYPAQFSNINYSDMTLIHEEGHVAINAANLNLETDLKAQLSQYDMAVTGGATPISNYGGTGGFYPNAGEFGADVYAAYKASGGTFQPSDQSVASAYNSTVDYFKSKGVLP